MMDQPQIRPVHQTRCVTGCLDQMNPCWIESNVDWTHFLIDQCACNNGKEGKMMVRSRTQQRTNKKTTEMGSKINPLDERA